MSGERVTLWTVESEDIPFLQRASANPEIRYPLGDPVRSPEQFGISDERETDQFLICVEDDAGPSQPTEEKMLRIGHVTVIDVADKCPELGYWLVPGVHGAGYGEESLTLVVDYVFREYDASAVSVEAYDDNDPSHNLLKQLGFTEEGRRRNFTFIDGGHRELVQYELLQREWRNQE